MVGKRKEKKCEKGKEKKKKRERKRKWKKKCLNKIKVVTNEQSVGWIKITFWLLDLCD